MRLIDADELKKAIDQLFEGGGFDSGLVMNTIEKAPTVGYPQGEWLDVICENGGFYHGTCSICKVRNDIPPVAFAHFCPNCGAHMGGNNNE